MKSPPISDFWVRLKMVVISTLSIQAFFEKLMINQWILG